ncbi:MAG: ClbS/DfsB family four-helix bundle protein [Actinomycetota bacterium]
MPRPTTRAELLAAAEHEFDRLWRAVELVPVEQREVPGACDDWSVKDLLAHLHAWQEMSLGWERAGRAGGRPAIPAEGYTFSQTPELNAEIHRRSRDDDWEDVCERLRSTHADLRSVIGSYEDGELFAKGRFAWTKSTSVGSYLVSATSSHYAWASKLIRAWAKRSASAART